MVTCRGGKQGAAERRDGKDGEAEKVGKMSAWVETKAKGVRLNCVYFLPIMQLLELN